MREIRDIAETTRTLVWSLRRFGERQVGLEPLPHSEFEVIRTVADNPSSTVSDVARVLGLQASNVSTTVRRLVDRGLIDRLPDAHDRRSTRLRLTDKASRHKKMIESVWVDGVRRQLDGMTDDEVALLVKAAPLFRRLAAMT
ncbi:MarR family transcriptional regulator [Mycobacterium sp. 1274761.0]|nr:MarR family transcriptional regulator [Mycobacterium sp. 1274761.0]